MFHQFDIQFRFYFFNENSPLTFIHKSIGSQQYNPSKKRNLLWSLHDSHDDLMLQTKLKAILTAPYEMKLSLYVFHVRIMKSN